MMFLTQICKKKCTKCVGSLCSFAWHHSCAFWSRMKYVAELPHLSATGSEKFGILQLVHKHKSFINYTLLQPLPLPKPWILAQLESFFHKCMLAFWTCKTPRKSPFS